MIDIINENLIEHGIFNAVKMLYYLLMNNNYAKSDTLKIAIFKGKKIRKTIHNNEWWFVIIDVVAALTDSAQPSGYIKDMRRRDTEL